ncbi:MAG TPA: hypothetical protein VN611_05835 [Patescibacteria group bacterium]|nr:hypothetical protein [Patescibacteria group bacterium]
MIWLGGIIVGAALLALAVWLYILRQGDAHFEFVVDRRTPFALTELTTQRAVFTSRVPFVNNGTQDGTIMDAFTRHHLPCEQFDGVEVASRLHLETAVRDDGYFESVIFYKGTGSAVVVTVILTAKNGDIQATLQDMVDMPVDIMYQIVARSEWYIHKTRMVMTSEEIQQALAAGISKGQG